MIDLKKDKLRVLVCPLNWGLGHASRCIPVIRRLKAEGFEVIVAAEGRALALLQEECGKIIIIRFPGFSPRFSSGRNLLLKIPGLLLSLAWHTLREHQKISRLVAENRIDVVISDNRFGLFTTKAKCVFITHQVMLKTPLYLKFTEPILYRINRYFIHKFDACWIPDLPGTDNLSGDLSHKYPLPNNASFIGLVSRFGRNKTTEYVTDGNLLALLSGPEPQRTTFERLINDQFEKENRKATIIRGTPSEKVEKESFNKILRINHLNTDRLAHLITYSDYVVCRSGYSTLMDLAVLGKKQVILVPTPGQTEQEYLAERLQEIGWMDFQPQNKFNLEKKIHDEKQYGGINLPTGEYLLDNQIKALVEDLH
jgi:uncharacterized protein (TIGR00661 family)